MTTMARARTAVRPATVPRLWPNSTVVCLGGGPSLTPPDVDYCRGKARVIAINDAYRLAPWADVLWACDERWWQFHKGAPGFAGLKFSLQPGAAKWPGVQILKNTGAEGVELKPTGLKNGRNGGYQAINLAVHLGATTILLLGYDMKRTGGKSHWFGEHPDGLQRHSPYENFRPKFDTLRAPLERLGVQVFNCSRETALKTFPRRPLAEVL